MIVQKRPDLKGSGCFLKHNVGSDESHSHLGSAHQPSSADEKLQSTLNKLIDELNLGHFNATSYVSSSEAKHKNSKCLLDSSCKVSLSKETWTSFAKLRLVYSLEVKRISIPWLSHSGSY